MEFPESVCDIRENWIREQKGWISPMYACTQLKSTITLYRDASDRPIEENIHYDAGCELRHKTDPYNSAPAAKSASNSGDADAPEKKVFVSS